ncbi:MAG: ComF family protein [Pseudomonadota bacterium]
MEMQKLLTLVYPAQCALCRDLVEPGGTLCAHCWSATPFIAGLVCDACGVPLMGEDSGGQIHCDDCMASPRPWLRGRAALEYHGNARRLVLALKHGDRQDLVAPCAAWMARAGRDLVHPDTLVVPIPLHWFRLFRRRFNQSAALARQVARRLHLRTCPDALVRTRPTPAQSGTVDMRAANLSDAIRPHPRRGAALAGQSVLLVDDVMTSGATLAAATQACQAAGARQVSALVLARVVKDV